jgi:iron-sulfur cluster assembly protein/iron-sulfur cluster insertion protein
VGESEEVIMSTAVGTEVAILTLDEAAGQRVRESAVSSGIGEGWMLRVEVRPGGCSGFSYDMALDTERVPDDHVFESAGVTVVVDPDSAELLRGASLIYEDTLQGAGLSINNPNAQRTCGCGKSFS